VYYIQADQIDTPRVVTDQANKVIWRWDGADPFGAGLPDEDPDGDGVRFTMNLRFPGQYFDRETGLHYNYFRDYDPGTGRYVESDPIGLGGGLNTFAYVDGSPLDDGDALGLADFHHPIVLIAPRLVVDSPEHSAWSGSVGPGGGGGPSGRPSGRPSEPAAKATQPSPALRASEPAQNVWPKTAREMTEILGVPPRQIPDSPKTPGRDKYEWRPSDNIRIIFERHPYHEDAPPYHKDYHWRIDWPGVVHKRFLPGDAMPGFSSACFVD
jgi:RHS repeat-associated protein